MKKKSFLLFTYKLPPKDLGKALISTGQGRVGGLRGLNLLPVFFGSYMFPFRGAAQEMQGSTLIVQIEAYVLIVKSKKIQNSINPTTQDTKLI